MSSAGDVVYLNGSFLPADEARISVFDRGFIFGDGVYEVIPAYGGRPFRLEHHLERLNHSLQGIRLANPLDNAHWEEILVRLIEENGGGELSVYLQVTRGVARREHAFPPDTPPTVFAMATPLTPVPEAILQHGISAVTVEDIRWNLCHIKAITLLPNILMKQQALDEEAVEAIMARNGEVTEGTASNVFLVKNGIVVTPPNGQLLLPGITRDLVAELCREHGIPFQEKNIIVDELRSADEIWITSSYWEVAAVTQLDHAPVGDGKPGPVWQRMIELYRDYKEAFRQGRRQ